MLTLVVEGRKPLLGRLCGDSEEEAHVELTPLGVAIRDEEVKKMSLYYPMVEVWKVCVMPDHLHLIVHIREEMPGGRHLGSAVRGFKTGCSRAWWKELSAGNAAETVTEKEAAVGNTEKAEGANAEKATMTKSSSRTSNSTTGRPISTRTPCAFG